MSLRLPPSMKKFLPHRVSWVVVSILLVAATTTFAAGDASSSTLLNNIYFFMSSIVIGIVQFVGNFTALMIHLLVIVSSYNEFINVPVVQTGWAIVRDITNMFFIIALLVIAAGTVLRIENYRYNRLLAKVIIMAFLVQFSRLITGFLIQSAQVVTLTFVNSYREVFFGNIANLFGLKQVLSLADQTLQQSAAGLSQIFISLLAGLTLMVVAFIVTLAIVIIFAIRIIALWILTILSPLAYALRILPNTEGFAKRWWSDFGKYVTIGPVLAFVLWLSLALISSTSPGAGISSKFNDTLGDAGTKYAQDNSVGTPFSSEITAIPNLLSFLVGVIFLIMGLQYASSLGGAAGKIAGSFSSAATGAALGTSGVAWLRDRTVAPVQKYWKARQDRNKDAVDRRAAGLGYAVDKVESATIGKAGRALQGTREAAGTAVSSGLRETGRLAGQAAGVAGSVARTAGRQTQRVAGELGTISKQVGQAVGQQAQRIAKGGLREGLVTPEERRRYGAATERLITPEERAQYQKAGVKAQEAVAGVPEALGRVGEETSESFVAGSAVGTRGERERQLRTGGYEAKQREEMDSQLATEKMTPEQRRAVALRSDNQDARMIAIHTMAANREIEVSEDLKKSNPELYKENQKLVQDRGADVMKNSRSIGDINKAIEKYDPEVVQHMFSQFGDPKKFDPHNQLLLASIGRFSEAFGEATNKAGEYIERNSRRVKELIKRGLVSTDSVNNTELLKKMHDVPGIGRDEWVEGLKNNGVLKSEYGSKAANVVLGVNSGKEKYASIKKTDKWFKTLQQATEIANKGGKMTYKEEQPNGSTVEKEGNALELMHLNGIDPNNAEALEGAVSDLGRDIRAFGKNFSKYELKNDSKWDAKTSASMGRVHNTFVENISSRAMPELYENNPTLVETVVDGTKGEEGAADIEGWKQKLDSDTTDPLVKKKIRSEAKRLKDNDLLSSLVADINTEEPKTPEPPKSDDYRRSRTGFTSNL